MLQEVISYVQRNSMLQEKDKVVIGISGGADSVCLFFMMLELRKQYNLELYAVHVNHGIRGDDADGDEEFVKELISTEGVVLTCIHENIKEYARVWKMTEEEAGRHVRYKAFYQVYSQYNCNKIAVAHHENDQAETVLFQLFRGSGLKGLSGIPPVRNEIIRPLLCVNRAEIEQYLSDNKIAYRTDKSNFTEAYTRNKIRLNIIEYTVKNINSQAVNHIAMAAGMLREAQEYIEKNAQIRFKKIVSTDNGKYSFLVDLFQKEDPVIQKEILRIILMKLCDQLKDFEACHIDMILSLTRKPVGKHRNLPYGICATRSYDSVILYKGTYEYENKQNEFQISIQIPGSYQMPNSNAKIHFEIIESKEENKIFPKNNCTKWFDYDRIKNTIFIRNRKSGDFLQIDSTGGHKKLKSYFIDNKIPKEERQNVPLLADGNHIMWVIGDRISEYYKVREDTTKILIVTIDGGTK